MNKDVLIGHTGFVGGVLGQQHPFGFRCNSANVADLEGGSFDTVVCAAAPGSMVAANRAPERDEAAIDSLKSSLRTFRARRFVLISTIAVLDRADAQLDETTMSFQDDLAYGRNRRRLEVFCQEQFPICLTLRLPALYGPGLRKNFLFDLLNPVPSMLSPGAWDGLQGQLASQVNAELVKHYRWDGAIGMHVLDRSGLNADRFRPEIERALNEIGATALQFTNPASQFQYYGLHRLWQDICRAQKAGLSLVHMAVEPLRAAEVCRHLVAGKMPENSARLYREDFRTMHDGLFGGRNGYVETHDEVLKGLTRWMSKERRK